MESIEKQVARLKAERAAMRAQISGKRNELVAIPDPVVIKNECAVKGLKLLSDNRLMLIG